MSKTVYTQPQAEILQFSVDEVISTSSELPWDVEWMNN